MIWLTGGESFLPVLRISHSGSIVAGVGPSDFLDLVSPAANQSDTDSNAIASFITEILRHEQGRGLNRVEFPDVPPWSRLNDVFTDAREIGPWEVTCSAGAQVPSIILPTTFEHYLQRLSSNRRSTMRRALDANPDACIVDGRHTEQEVHRALRRLADWSVGWWSHRATESVLREPTFRSFFLAVVPQLIQAGAAEIALLTNEHGPYSAMVVLKDHNRHYYYLSGHDPGQRELSPGTAQLAYAINRAILAGAESFELLRGSEPYKMSLGARPAVSSQFLLRRTHSSRENTESVKRLRPRTSGR